VLGEKTLLSQIFSNLLENALTYRRPAVPPRVTVSWQAGAGLAVIRVSDNGIGIPAEHQEKIFHIFQRLHNEDEYPGTGIGLATVKKCVELLGGQVRVESIMGEGSTLSIELPTG
jgi:signal transduction histidine kinase